MLNFCGPAQPSDDHILGLIEYPGCSAGPAPDFPLLGELRKAILEYLEHGSALPAFPLDLRKGTPFQREVWEALSRIPFAQTRSYLEVSQSLGRPRSARAVGQACGKNPIALLIPCHRVVSTGGQPGGYSGGLEIKKTLLKLEHARAATPLTSS